jgi:hypothetical protein
MLVPYALVVYTTSWIQRGFCKKDSFAGNIQCADTPKTINSKLINWQEPYVIFLVTCVRFLCVCTNPRMSFRHQVSAWAGSTIYPRVFYESSLAVVPHQQKMPTNGSITFSTNVFFVVKPQITKSHRWLVSHSPTSRLLLVPSGLWT